MENRLKNHIDILFRDMSQDENTDEIKAEILQNLIDKYYDLLNDGNDPETAYSIAVASVGDVRSLLSDNSTSEEKLILQQKKRSAKLISGAVMLYILSVIPCIIGGTMGRDNGAIIGLGFMFLMIAVATGMIIYNANTKYNSPKNQGIAKKFKHSHGVVSSQKRIKNQISGIIWTCVLVVYFLVSFLTGAWYITWLIFLIGLAVDQIIGLCMLLCFEKEKKL